ncbi:MAG TPA: DUF6528 family protein [Cyclobacteriaceae bacterium]|nr:DUF6528 family protein [Cyclobacteriaceae bacterium]
MLKYLNCLVLFFLCVSYAFAQQEQSKMFLVGGDSKLLLVDYNKSQGSQPHVLWTWDAHDAADLPEQYRNRKFNSVDDSKAIAKGEKILVSSSSGAIAVLRTQDRKVLYYADVPNAHSIEMLPGNRLVAAASTHKLGNKIMLFDLSEPDKLLYTDSLYSAHGLVWIEEKESLYALGYDVLREYKLASSDSLMKVNEWKIPGESGHDLWLGPDRESLFMTEHSGTWVFDLANGTFSKKEGMPDAENIKSVGQNQEGQYIYTEPEESWWTFHVSFSQPDRKIAFPDIKVYKVRWFNP